MPTAGAEILWFYGKAKWPAAGAEISELENRKIRIGENEKKNTAQNALDT